jgi:hypothetical protein
MLDEALLALQASRQFSRPGSESRPVSEVMRLRASLSRHNLIAVIVSTLSQTAISRSLHQPHAPGLSTTSFAANIR